jgi:glycerophosphoryl diester phosphodiesterase
MLRRRKSDPPFLRDNLLAALRCEAACEVDIRFTRDGHAVCLHDALLDRETTGTGRVDAMPRAAVERLHQRDVDGASLDAAPLFLDEIVDVVGAIGTAEPALVQLDVKARAEALTTPALERIARVLGANADAFIASAYDWDTIRAITEAVPGLHAGFDPLALYPRSLALDADGFRALADRTRDTAPTATFYYLEANLILAALDNRVDLVAEVGRDGAQVDAWTIDADRPDLDTVLHRLIAARCFQITSNDPEQLAERIRQLT